MNDLIYKLAVKNNGLTSDEPLIITCQNCNDAETGGFVYMSNMRTNCYCYNCNNWFHYEYIIDRWYYGFSTTDKIPCCRKYGNFYDKNEKLNYDLLKSLYNKYKNTEYGSLIMAEILGQK